VGKFTFKRNFRNEVSTLLMMMTIIFAISTTLLATKNQQQTQNGKACPVGANGSVKAQVGRIICVRL